MEAHKYKCMRVHMTHLPPPQQQPAGLEALQHIPPWRCRSWCLPCLLLSSYHAQKQHVGWGNWVRKVLFSISSNYGHLGDGVGGVGHTVVPLPPRKDAWAEPRHPSPVQVDAPQQPSGCMALPCHGVLASVLSKGPKVGLVEGEEGGRQLSAIPSPACPHVCHFLMCPTRITNSNKPRLD